MNTEERSSSRPKWKHILTAALLTTVLAACGGTTIPPADNNGDTDPAGPQGVITGVITNSSGAAASNLQLSVSNTTSRVSADNLEVMSVTTTDEAGQFAFDVSTAGTYGITGISGSEGVYFQVPVTLDADGKLTSEPVTQSTAPLGAVTGSIHTERAGVMISLLGTSFLALTDTDGAFNITGVPAGEYSIAATVAGHTGASRTVTVKSGESTELTAALEFGPTITSVTPEGITSMETVSGPYGDYMTYPVHEIEGSGFGDGIGISRLLFAGKDITSLVTTWTDTHITVDINNNHLYEYQLEFTTVDDLHFTVVTPSGSADTPTAATIDAYSHYNELDDGTRLYSLDPTVMNGFYPEGLTFDLSTNHGTLHVNAPDGPETSTHTIDYSGDGDRFVPVPNPTATVPMITTTSLAGTPLDRFISGNDGYLELISPERNTPGEPTTYQLQLISDDVTYTDDGKFTYTLELPNYSNNCPAFTATPLAPFQFDNNGNTSVTLPAFPLIPAYESCSVVVSVYYDGLSFTTLHIHLTHEEHLP